MSARRRFRTAPIAWAVLLALCAPQAFSQASSPASTKDGQRAVQARDGQHDFDFEIGTWKTHLRRLRAPLTGSTDTGLWVRPCAMFFGQVELDGRPQPRFAPIV